MLVPILVSFIIILGVIVGYIYFIAPKINPRNRANVFLKQNQLNEAIFEFKKILDVNPHDFLTHFQLGNLYYQIEEFDKAVFHFEKIIDINKFNYEVSKLEVQKKLASLYMRREQFEFSTFFYLQILKQSPSDKEALYHVGFIALGQENFDLSFKLLHRLIGLNFKNFEILFGAGIAAYQIFKTNEAIDYLKQALLENSYSDIANLAISFAFYRKSDYKTALNYAKIVVDNTKDSNASFIAKRLYGILLLLSKSENEAFNVFEELLAFSEENNFDEENLLLLYDIGFVCLRAEKTEEAYSYWNKLYKKNREFHNIAYLTTNLRKEKDIISNEKSKESAKILFSEFDEWIKNVFPENYIWKICGLKSDNDIDLENILFKVDGIKEKKDSVLGNLSEKTTPVLSNNSIEKFLKIDAENFRIISNRIITKLGYSVDEILLTYKESDGVDFFAKSIDNQSTALIWVRRWKNINIGEIPLRDFAQAINDSNAKSGIFVTTMPLTASAENTLKNLSKIKVVYPEQLDELLDGLI